MKRAASRPMAVPSMRTVVSAGSCRRRTRGRRSRRRPVAPAPRCRAPAPRSSRPAPADRSCRTPHRRPGMPQQPARPARPLRSVVGAGTTDRRTFGKPSCARGGANASRRRRERSSSPATTARRRRPLACRNSATARADVLMREAHQHVDRRRRQIPGLDHRDAGGQQPLAPSAECTMPVSTMPSGRRPMMASSSASSRDSDVAALAEHELVAAARPALRSAPGPSAGTPARRSSAPRRRPAGCASRPGRRPAGCGT